MAIRSNAGATEGGCEGLNTMGEGLPHAAITEGMSQA
jgi:hypothetical protein